MRAPQGRRHTPYPFARARVAVSRCPTHLCSITSRLDCWSMLHLSFSRSSSRALKQRATHPGPARGISPRTDRRPGAASAREAAWMLACPKLALHVQAPCHLRSKHARMNHPTPLLARSVFPSRGSAERTEMAVELNLAWA